MTKEVKVIENSIYRQINGSIEQLGLLSTFIQQNPDPSHEQFHTFVTTLMQGANTLKAMSWNPLVQQSQKLFHEQKLTQLYQKEIAIRGDSLAIDDGIVYVKFISPEQNNNKAIGFNVYSNPSRKETLDLTMVNYQPQATPLIQLVQSFKDEPAFLLFFPVFEQSKSNQKKKLIGFATAVFMARKIINNALNNKQNKLFYYEVFEQNKVQPFMSNTHKNQTFSKDIKKYFSHTFNVAGQTWYINLRTNTHYLNQQQYREFLHFFLLLVVITITIITSLLLMHNRQLQLNRLIEKRTKSLKSAMLDASNANKAKSHFLANMSHEIRTPMNSVMGFIELAKVSDDIDEIKAYLKNIDVSSNFLLHIINNILDISTIESEKLSLTHETFDISS